MLCSEEYEAGKKPPVVTLEARQACSGATPRNRITNSPLPNTEADRHLGGYLKPSVYGRLPDYTDKFGVEAAAEVADFE
jgi:hypothetical protein